MPSAVKRQNLRRRNNGRLLRSLPLSLPFPLLPPNLGMALCPQFKLKLFTCNTGCLDSLLFIARKPSNLYSASCAALLKCCATSPSATPSISRLTLLDLPASSWSETWRMRKFSAGRPAGVWRSSLRSINLPVRTTWLRFTALQGSGRSRLLRSRFGLRTLARGLGALADHRARLFFLHHR